MPQPHRPVARRLTDHRRGSYLHARSQGGQWLLRIEDLDPPREVPGAADAILRTLKPSGFAWDGPVIWQSQRLTAYQDALDALIASGHAYPAPAPAAKSPWPATLE